MEDEYYYSVEASVPDCVTKVIDTLKKRVDKKYVVEFKHDQNIVIAFGPSLSNTPSKNKTEVTEYQEVKEITTCKSTEDKEKINILLNGFYTAFHGELPDANLGNIIVSKRQGQDGKMRYILNVVINSDKIDSMYRHLRTKVPSIKKFYDDQHKRLEKSEDTYRGLYKKGNYKGVCNIRIGLLKTSMTDDELKDLLKYLNEKKENKENSFFQVKNIMLISAVTQTPVVLW